MSPYGIEYKNSIQPFSIEEKQDLILEFDNLEKLISSYKKNSEIFKEIEDLLRRFKNVRGTIKRCRNLNTLDDVEFYEIKIFSMLCEELRKKLGDLELTLKNFDILPLEDVINILDPEDKLLPTFHIYSAYSEKLLKLRRKKLKLEQEIMTESESSAQKALRDERLEIVSKEEDEEMNVRIHLTEKLSEYDEILEINTKSIGYFDFLLAKAVLAIERKANRPIINQGLSITLIEMFNPYIKDILEENGKKFIPISLNLNKGVTVITGANMGGKTVTLYTALLNVMLVRLGFFTFALRAEIPLFDSVAFISEDLQSVSRGLSTFGADIMSLRRLLEESKESKVFTVMDEFARGTNPEEGTYLLKAILDYLSELNYVTLIATHYDGVVGKNMTHYQVRGLKDVDFEKLKNEIDTNNKSSVDLIQEHMDYRLEKVETESNVPKDALNISILLGLDEKIIRLAKEYFKNQESNGKEKTNEE